MALESNFSNLSDNGFGSGSEQGKLSGIRFGTIVDDIVPGDPVFSEHVVRLYQVLSADTVDAEVGIDGLVAAQNVKVNEKLLTDDLEIEGNFTLSGGLTVPGNLTVEGNVSVEGDFEFSDASSNFGTNATEAIENAFNDSSDATFTFSGGQIDVSLNDNTVDEDEINASGSGFLSNSGGSLSYDGLNTSGEFNGDGTSGSQLSIANNSIGDSELENMPDGSMKVGDGGDPYNLELGSDAVPVSTTEVGGTNIVGANINSEQVLGRGSSGGITALDISGDVKPLLGLEAGDINAGTFDQGSQRFAFDDRLDMRGGALITGNARIDFRENSNEGFIDFWDGSDPNLTLGGNDTEKVIVKTGGAFDDGLIVESSQPRVTLQESDQVGEDNYMRSFDGDFYINSENSIDIRAGSNDSDTVDIDTGGDINIDPGFDHRVDVDRSLTVGGDVTFIDQFTDIPGTNVNGPLIWFEDPRTSNINASDIPQGTAILFAYEEDNGDIDLEWREHTDDGSTFSNNLGS